MGEFIDPMAKTEALLEANTTAAAINTTRLIKAMEEVMKRLDEQKVFLEEIVG